MGYGRIFLRSQDLWNLVVEEDLIDPEAFKALTEFKKYIRHVVSLSLIQDSIDY